MAPKKRAVARPRPRRGRKETQRGLDALAAAQRGGLETKQLASEPATNYLSFAQTVAVTGINKGRLGEVVRRAGVTVYRSPFDSRKKFLRREDVDRLTGFSPETPEGPSGGSPETGD